MVRFKRKYDAKWSGRLGAGTASHCSDKWNWQRLGYCDTKQRVLIMKSAYLMLKLYSPHGACQRPFIITSEGPGYNIKHSYEFITPRPLQHRYTPPQVSVSRWAANSKQNASAANRLIVEVVQSRRRPLLGPSPGWKRLLALSHLRHY